MQPAVIFHDLMVNLLWFLTVSSTRMEALTGEGLCSTFLVCLWIQGSFWSYLLYGEIHLDTCFMARISTMVLITHRESDIMQCEVKWALGSITMNKTGRGDGIPLELFQILKYDDMKVLPSICQKIWKTWHWAQDWKMSVFIPIPKGNAKKLHSSCTLAK